MLRYTVEVWEQRIENKQALIHVLPLLFYHGEQKWKPRPFREYFPIRDAFLERFLPSCKLHFVSANELSDAQILQLGARLLINSILAMKHSKDPKASVQEAELIFNLPFSEDEDEFRNFSIKGLGN